jgi:Secretion system C-terminal sorting domain
VPTANDVLVSGINIPSGFTLNPDGTFNIALGTPANIYIFSYRICEIANPTNCATATSIFNLTSNIQAVYDTINFLTPPVNGSTISVLSNDVLNGLAPDSTSVNVSFINIPAGFILNSDGTLTIPASFTQGNFNLDYRICETAFPDNCAISNASIVIANPFAPTGNVVQPMPVSGTLAGLNVNGQNILWYEGALNKSAATTPLSPTTPIVIGATYYATQTVNGIESLDKLPVTVSNILSTSNIALSNLKLYPNPVTENLMISNDTNISIVEIYSTTGQRILVEKPNNTATIIHTNILGNGLYFVKISTENVSQIVKIVKN